LSSQKKNGKETAAWPDRSTSEQHEQRTGCLFSISRRSSVVASAAMLGCWGGLTFLPNWIHQLSATVAGHSDVDSTVSYAFILTMIGATLGYLTLIRMLEALDRWVPTHPAVQPAYTRARASASTDWHSSWSYGAHLEY
jgi:hypothetical protein